MIGLHLARWRVGLSIAAALALMGLVAGLSRYRSAYHAERALRQADRAAFAQAQAEASRIAQEALAHQEHIYVTKARESEHEYVSNLADARTAADRFIAANRVRGQTAACHASTAAPSASGGSASVPADMPGGVVMDETDVRRAGEWQAYGTACHNWAMSLQIGQ